METIVLVIKTIFCGIWMIIYVWLIAHIMIIVSLGGNFDYFIRDLKLACRKIKIAINLTTFLSEIIKCYKCHGKFRPDYETDGYICDNCNIYTHRFIEFLDGG